MLRTMLGTMLRAGAARSRAASISGRVVLV